MDIDQVREFARENHRAVMATRTPSGSIQQSPVLVSVDAEGAFIVSSRETAYKTKNVRSEPWAQLCLFTDAFFGQWAYVDGYVEVVSLPEAMEYLQEYYRSISGEHPDWDEYRASMRAEKRVVLRVHARAAGPNKQG